MKTGGDSLVIDGVDVSVRDGRTRLRAAIDGDELWYEFNGVYPLAPRGEPFLSVALLLAMVAGRSVVIRSAPVSERLLNRLSHLQRLIRLWNPETHLVSVVSDTAPVIPHADMVTTTYSGGVDSSCTVMLHGQEITHLVSLNCFDRGATETWEQIERTLRAKAAVIGKQIITVDTNVHVFVRRHGANMNYAHGSVLAALTAALGPRRGFIPSSYTYRELKPWGSHPLLDPLWSTETTEIVHDGAELRRSEKTAIIGTSAEMLSQLQVCWHSKVSNCGRCAKCVRTMLALQILQLGPGPFPATDPLRNIGQLMPGISIAAEGVWDLWKMAEERGQRDIAARLGRLIRRYKLRRATNALLKTLAGPRVTKAVNRLRGAHWVDMALPLRDPDDLT